MPVDHDVVTKAKRQWENEFYKPENGIYKWKYPNPEEIENFWLKIVQEAFDLGRAAGREEERDKRHNWVVGRLDNAAYCKKCHYMMKYENNDYDCPGEAPHVELRVTPQAEQKRSEE